MRRAKFLVKEAEFDGNSRNPFARGGHVNRYSKWHTIARCDTAKEALQVKHARTSGLFKRGIWYKSQRIDDRISEFLGADA
jgi:hypothetical protein